MIKKAYDALVIIKANLGEDTQNEVLERFKSWVTDNEGDIQEFNVFSQTEMPVTFRPATHAVYFHCVFDGTNATLDALREKMKVDESFLRDMIVTLDSIKDTRSLEEKVKKG